MKTVHCMGFKQLSKIDAKTKDTVNGWIRNKEKILTLRNVPSIIKAICILYYREFELFDKDLIMKELKVDDEYKIMSTDNINVGGSAFGTNIAMKGRKYHWKVKVERDNEKCYEAINIGIIEENKAKEHLAGDKAWWRQNYGYSYYNRGTIWNAECRRHGNNYGGLILAGDIIDIWLDLKDDNSLSYARNGEYYGVAFKIPNDKKYRFAGSVSFGKIVIKNLEVFYK